MQCSSALIRSIRLIVSGLFLLNSKYGVPAGYGLGRILRAGGFSAHGPDLRLAIKTLGRYVEKFLGQKAYVAARRMTSRRITAARPKGLMEMLPKGMELSFQLPLRDNVRRYRSPAS